MFCPNCGKPNSEQSNYCAVCGHGLHYQGVNPTERIPRATNINTGKPNISSDEIFGVKENELRIACGENSDYYLKQLQVMEVACVKYSWNWFAFLFPGIWLLYRKMYKYFAISVVIGVLGVILLPKLLALVSILMAIGFGAFGNYLYFLHMREKILIAKHFSKDQESFKRLLTEAGGNDVRWPAILGGVILILIIILMSSSSFVNFLKYDLNLYKYF